MILRMEEIKLQGGRNANGEEVVSTSGEMERPFIVQGKIVAQGAGA